MLVNTILACESLHFVVDYVKILTEYRKFAYKCHSSYLHHLGGCGAGTVAGGEDPGAVAGGGTEI